MTVLCDFDGTVTEIDVSVALIDKFSGGKWRELDNKFVKGLCGSKEAYKAIAELMEGKEEDMVKFSVDFARLSEGFLDFMKFCKEQGMKMLTVSDGFDVYIKPIFEKYGIRTDFFSGIMKFEGCKVKVEFPHASSFCELCATCKLEILRKFKDDFVVFIGNGISDRCAIEEANVVFAKSKLKTICSERNIPFFPFNNFKDILKIFRKKHKLKGFIFDFDGTLAWTYEGIEDALKYAFLELGIEIFREDIMKLVGLPLSEIFRKFLGDESKVKKGVSLFRERYAKVYLEKTKLIDGVLDVLLALDDFKMAICSNKKGDFTRNLVDALGISNFFEIILGEDDVEMLKPHPEMLLRALSAMKLKPDEIFFIGDTPLDIMTGKLAEVDTVCISMIYKPDELEGASFIGFEIEDVLKVANFLR